MLPFETPTIFEQLPKQLFSVPKVVSNQKDKFESDELFRRLSRECEIRYVGYKDRPLVERRLRFQTGCREGTTDLVHFKSSFIMNGVCVYCKGWIDLEKLEGIGCLEYDQERGAIEDAFLREQIKEWNDKIKQMQHPLISNEKSITSNKLYEKNERNNLPNQIDNRFCGMQLGRSLMV
ncbi:protein big brother-like isoform X2 [Panonychus citri]|uniref:protein big brother-like isoform X2 n=1 Tax=Panonychus citri TaxID=50023 RepID=UPI002306F07D|nr:protein big brother-like isoform X2 [Panonychus citri]